MRLYRSGGKGPLSALFFVVVVEAVESVDFRREAMWKMRAGTLQRCRRAADSSGDWTENERVATILIIFDQQDDDLEMWESQ